MNTGLSVRTNQMNGRYIFRLAEKADRLRGAKNLERTLSGQGSAEWRNLCQDLRTWGPWRSLFDQSGNFFYSLGINCRLWFSEPGEDLGRQGLVLD